MVLVVAVKTYFPIRYVHYLFVVDKKLSIPNALSHKLFNVLVFMRYATNPGRVLKIICKRIHLSMINSTVNDTARYCNTSF